MFAKSLSIILSIFYIIRVFAYYYGNYNNKANLISPRYQNK